MSTENLFSMLAASVVSDAFQQHGGRTRDMDMASRKAEEAAGRRYEAASWLRRTVGVVAGKELAEEPSEEEFRLGLRSGFILCSALNKVRPGTIPKVVACPVDSGDETALAAYQHFENVRNYLVAAEEIGVPVFEASDLEKGGNSGRVVNSILALKSYSEWQRSGGNGVWRYGGSAKPSNPGKLLYGKFPSPSRDPYQEVPPRMGSLMMLNKIFLIMKWLMKSCSMNTLLLALRTEENHEELPKLAESMLEKIMGVVMQELERRVSSHTDLIKSTPDDSVLEPKVKLTLKDTVLEPKVKSTPEDPVENNACTTPKRKVLADPFSAPVLQEIKVGDENVVHYKGDDVCRMPSEEEMEKLEKLEKQRIILEQQTNYIQELKDMLRSTKACLQSMQGKYSDDLCNLGKHFQSLSHAASGYHKVLEENRKLYNEIQDLKGSIRVYCRVRPFSPGHASSMSTVGHIDDESITIITSLKNGKEARKRFKFNKVFGPSTTQGEVFSDTQPLIRSIIDGYNVCIFAYGQTGSGKTHTMTGPRDITEQTQGVNYRALNDLFSLTEQRKDEFSYDISVQMIEIYNEQVRDLLAIDGQIRKLEIRNNSQNDLNVPDANLVHVTSTCDVIELMNVGQKNRAICSTAMNDRSSRSHSCLTVHVQGKELASGAVLRGRLHLVDLAGSERVNKSEVTGERLKEAQHINKSLSALGDVIASLAQKNPHVPYRNSKLTQLLQDSLGGQAKTLMFVHISPEADAAGETISTLKFAERVASVELGAAHVNKDTSEVKVLKEKIASLKEALASKHGGQQNLQMTGSWIPKSGETSPIDPNMQTGMVHQISYRQLHENKAEARDDDSSVDWSEDTDQLSEFFYQKYLPDRRVFQEQFNRSVSGRKSQDFDLQRTRPECAVTDDSEDFDVATIDSSESDMSWQFNRSVSENGNMSRIKRPQTRPPQSPETRTHIQPHVPAPSRKSSLQTPRQVGRRPIEAKRRPSNGKVANRK